MFLVERGGSWGWHFRYSKVSFGVYDKFTCQYGGAVKCLCYKISLSPFKRFCTNSSSLRRRHRSGTADVIVGRFAKQEVVITSRLVAGGRSQALALASSSHRVFPSLVGISMAEFLRRLKLEKKGFYFCKYMVKWNQKFHRCVFYINLITVFLLCFFFVDESQIFRILL